jgi:hypothetical protein
LPAALVTECDEWGSGERISDAKRNQNGESRFEASLNSNIDVRPRNWLAPVALAMLREESAHGYVLMERIAAFGFEQKINPGPL